MNRVKTWKWKAILKMTRSLALKLACTLGGFGRGGGKPAEA